LFEWIVDTIAEAGYLGIVMLMFLENLFPPIPSELIMPLAGFNAARGRLSGVGVVAAGMFGSLLGALPWYCVGRLLGEERLSRSADRWGRWLTVSSKDIERAALWFNRHGAKAVLMGRLVPGVRTFISVPAGIARMPVLQFVLYSALGTLVWTSILAWAGYILESQYARVAQYLNPVSKFVITLIIGVYLYRLITRKRGSSRRS
jgi:membrane protein DedA with SNARE-associated domain